MNFETTQKAILQHLKTNWTGAAAIPLQMPNHKFKQPDTPWGRVSINLGNKNSVAIGNRRDRMIGILAINVFIPKETGSQAATQAADLMAQIFDDWQSIPAPGNLIEFEKTGIQGPFERPTHDQYALRAQFRVDETR